MSKSKSRIVTKAAAVPTPRTRAEMESLVAQIATLKREEATLKLRMDKTIAKVKEDFAEVLSGIAADLQPMTLAAENWATSNPAEFGKNKSIKFLQGIVGFRTGQPKLEPLNKKWNWEKITSAVRTYLPAFIRDKPEVDREAIIAQRAEQVIIDVLPLVGLKVTQDEGFFVEPVMTSIEKRETVSTN